MGLPTKNKTIKYGMMNAPPTNESKVHLNKSNVQLSMFNTNRHYLKQWKEISKRFLNQLKVQYMT